MTDKNTGMQECISNLNGYCHALRRLSSSRLLIRAYLVKLSPTIEETIERALKDSDNAKADFKVEEMSFNDVEKKIDVIVFSKLNDISEEVRKNMAWDFYEYFGLASTMSESEIWNPIVSNGAWMLIGDTPDHENKTMMLVQCQDQAIITSIVYE